MLYNNQFSYDNAIEPVLSDYQDDPAFAEFVEYVTFELLNERDWQNLSSITMITCLKCVGGGYQTALDWVCGRLSEKQYLEYLEELNQD